MNATKTPAVPTRPTDAEMNALHDILNRYRVSMNDARTLFRIVRSLAADAAAPDDGWRDNADVISLRNDVRSAVTDADQVAALDALCTYLAAAVRGGAK